MMNLAESGDVSSNAVVIRWVGEDSSCMQAIHQQRIGALVQSVPTDEPVAAEQPQIARLRDLDSRLCFRQLISRILSAGRCRRKILYDHVNLAHLKPGCFKAELEVDL